MRSVGWRPETAGHPVRQSERLRAAIVRSVAASDFRGFLFVVDGQLLQRSDCLCVPDHMDKTPAPPCLLPEVGLLSSVGNVDQQVDGTDELARRVEERRRIGREGRPSGRSAMAVTPLTARFSWIATAMEH